MTEETDIVKLTMMPSYVQETPEAMLNSIILTEIFRQLSLPFLVNNARLVCRRWNEICLYVMKCKNMWRLTLEKSLSYNQGKTIGDLLDTFKTSQNFPCTRITLLSKLKGMDYSEDRGLEQENELRLHSLQAQIEADEAGANTLKISDKHYNEYQLLRFLKFYGKSIKYATIFPTYEYAETITHIFLKQLPNLQILDITVRSMELYRPEFMTKQLDAAQFIKSSLLLLPFLKQVRFRDLSKDQSRILTQPIQAVLEAILKSAPNLEECVDFRVDMIQTLIRTGQIHTVQDLQLNLVDFLISNNYVCNLKKIESLVKLANTEPKLRCLKIAMNTAKASCLRRTPFKISSDALDAFSRILKSSQTSLTHLEIPAQELDIPFPSILANLTRLSLTRIHFNRQRHPPPAPGAIHRGRIINFMKSSTFPILRCLELSVENMCLPSLTECLEETLFDTSSSTAEMTSSQDNVKTLIFSVTKTAKHDDKIGPYLHIKFPNLYKVTFTNYDAPWKQLSRGIYVLPKTVEIIVLKGMCFHHKDFELDCFFLGIGKDICKRLSLRLLDDDCRLELTSIRQIWEKNKKHPGILDLPNLKRLCLLFDHLENDEFIFEQASSTKIITRLSWLLGFQKMPDLSVQFMYDYESDGKEDDFNAALKLIEPFIKISHYSTDI